MNIFESQLVITEQWVIDWIARATVLLILALAVNACLARHQKHLLASSVWNGLLLALLLLPLAGFVLKPTVSVSVAQPYQDANHLMQKPHEFETEADSGQNTILLTENQLAKSEQRHNRNSMTGPNSLFPKLNWSLIGLIGFCAVSMLFMSRLILQFFKTLSLRRQARTVECPRIQWHLSDLKQKMNLKKPIGLLDSRWVRIPMVVGWIRPAILLPNNMTRTNSSTIRCVLLHELTHIKRRDPFWNLVLRIVGTLYWFHPLVWVARKRIVINREIACDEYCIYHVGNNKTYGETLIDIAKLAISGDKPKTASVTTGLAVIQTSELRKRIELIAESEGNMACNLKTNSRIISLAIVTTIVVAFSSTTLFQLNAHTQPLVTTPSLAEPSADRDIPKKTVGNAMGKQMQEAERDDPPPHRSKAERWRFELEVESADEYAELLDHFKIELGAISKTSNEIDLISDLTNEKPTKRETDKQTEKRFYCFSYKGSQREWASELAEKADVEDMDDRIIVQFFNDEICKTLLELEKDKIEEDGESAIEIKRCLFRVRKTDNDFEIYVHEIKYRKLPRN